VNAEFNWWLLIVGLVIGAALTWLVMAEAARRDADVGDEERRGEAVWIASLLSSPDRPEDARRVEEILRLHREYLAAPPPDEPDEEELPADVEPTPQPAEVEQVPPLADPIVTETAIEPDGSERRQGTPTAPVQEP